VSNPAHTIRALYLNLDQEAFRRCSIEGQLADAGIAAERVAAVDGRKPLPRELSLYFDARHLMDPGALGCYASHIKAWEQVIRKALPYALVLEDDAILPPGLGRALTHIVAALPKGWDMVHLGSRSDITGRYFPPFGRASASGARRAVDCVPHSATRRPAHSRRT
jgi:GR25 family glycosyltransferase involved in LPS biosynthesis